MADFWIAEGVARKDQMTMDEIRESYPAEDWYDLTLDLRDKTVQQIADLSQVQIDLQKWYAARPGKPSPKLELNECPALLRVMQVIRLLRESQLEFEQQLQDSTHTA
jgi:hypothetical protein